MRSSRRTVSCLTLAGAALLPAWPAATQGTGADGPYGPAAVGIESSLETAPQPARAGEPTTLELAVTHDDGQPVEKLLMHHGREIHVVLISEDMQVFGHIHPQDFGEPFADGKTRVRFEFPRPGRYLASADMMTEEGTYAEDFLLAVEGDAAAMEYVTPVPASLVATEVGEDDSYTAPVIFDAPGTSGGYEASVSRPARIAAGTPTTFTWRLSKDGVPITDLRLFLQAAMHLAVVKDDLGHFLHAHGTPKGIDTGYDHAHGPGGVEVASDQTDAIEYFGPEIVASLTFPEPGRYYLFGQSAHGEALLISRVPVDVW